MIFLAFILFFPISGLDHYKYYSASLQRTQGLSDDALEMAQTLISAGKVKQMYSPVAISFGENVYHTIDKLTN